MTETEKKLRQEELRPKSYLRWRLVRVLLLLVDG